MADHQRIHPVVADVEAATPPTRPPMPRVTFKAEKGYTQLQPDPLTHPVQATPAVAPPLTRPVQAMPGVPPPLTRPVQAMPYAPPMKPKKRNCWCKCLCWTVGLLILLLIIVGAIVGILYLVFKPKLPNYSVDNLRISDLTLNFDLSLYARFNVRLTAVNPNKKIGIYYEKGSRLSVWYKNTNLCQGTIPSFYQGHQNKTVLNVSLSGQNQYGQTLLQAMQEQQQTGRIPLDLKINVPVRIKLGRLKLKKVRVTGTCLLIVDSLSTNSLINIKASTCHFGVKL